MNRRRAFLSSAVGMGSSAALVTMASAAAAPGGRTRAAGGIRVGNLYFSGGLTGVNPERRENPSASAGDIKEQTERTLEAHKKNLEAVGTGLENVVKATVFLADPKNERSGMNEVYAKYFPKDAPARSAVEVQFPDDATRVEIGLVAWIPDK